MRANIKQRRVHSRPPIMQAPESPTGSNGVDATEAAPTQPSVPVNPAPELVQAVVQLIQRVNQLEQVVGAMARKDSVEGQALVLKARCEALKRAVELIPVDLTDADTISAGVAQIDAIADHFVPLLCRPYWSPPEEPPPQ